MTRLLSIAIGSTCSRPGDQAGNLAQIGAFAAQAGKVGCDLLLTPEMSATGYGGYAEVLALAETAGAGPIYQELRQLARAHSLVISAGFVEQAEGKRYLAQYVVYPDGQFVVQRKHRVTPREAPLTPAVELYYDQSEDIGHVPAGSERFTFFQVKQVKCGIVICADLGVRGLQHVFAQNQVELMLLPTAAGGQRDDQCDNALLRTEAGLQRYYALMKDACFPGNGIKDCVQQRRALAAVNMCGYDGQVFYHGGQGSLINAFGDVVALIAGIPNRDRARPRFAWGEIDFDETG